jgi:hypothetical protein
MPFIVILVGLFLAVTAARNKHQELAELVKGDFTGPNNFFSWLIALLVIGGLGYIKPLKPLTDAFLVLLILVLFLSNGGFFDRITRDLGINT